MIGSLGSPQRLRVLAAVILGAGTVAEVRAATGLDARTVHREADRLIVAGAVEADADGRFVARTADLARVARSIAKVSSGAAPAAPPETQGERVRRAFLKDGRLDSIPSQRSKRLVILDVLAQEFEPGRRYSEQMVNLMLGKWHADTAALRRYLVDEGFLDRESGVYWRVGGTVAT
jgi:hypothetical protein